MGFSQALSGLNAASSNLNVVSNNIANSQTVGFKSSTTQFADVYASSRVGLGVQVAGVVQNFTSGNLETTDRSLDLAISGSGFFRFEQAGQVVYSRNGQLTLTPEGYLQNAQGARLLGSNGAIQIPADGLQAQPTAHNTLEFGQAAADSDRRGHTIGHHFNGLVSVAGHADDHRIA